MGAEYDFSAPGEAGPFVFGEIGVMRHKYEPEGATPEPYEEETSTGFAFGGGAGYSIPIGSLNGYVLGRYLQGQFDGGNTAFFGAMAGLAIPLGGN